MTRERAPGFHVRPGRAVDASAYEQFTGRWSRLFVPLVLEAADIQPGDQVLDMCTGTGEAAIAIAPAIGPSGCLIGVDIAAPMLDSARGRLAEPTFLPVAADGQALPFQDRCFDAVVCQLGLQFFPNPGLGLKEFRRVLRDGAAPGYASSPAQTAPRCGASLPICLAAFCLSSSKLFIFPSRFATRRGWRLCSWMPDFRRFESNDKRARIVMIASTNTGIRSRRALGPSRRHI